MFISGLVKVGMVFGFDPISPPCMSVFSLTIYIYSGKVTHLDYCSCIYLCLLSEILPLSPGPEDIFYEQCLFNDLDPDITARELCLKQNNLYILKFDKIFFF